MRSLAVFVLALAACGDSSWSDVDITTEPPAPSRLLETIEVTCEVTANRVTLRGTFDVSLEPYEIFVVDPVILNAPSLESAAVPPTTFACDTWETVKLGTTADLGCKRLPSMDEEQQVEMVRTLVGADLVPEDVAALFVLSVENTTQMPSPHDAQHVTCTYN